MFIENSVLGGGVGKCLPRCVPEIGCEHWHPWLHICGDLLFSIVNCTSYTGGQLTAGGEWPAVDWDSFVDCNLKGGVMVRKLILGPILRPVIGFHIQP